MTSLELIKFAEDNGIIVEYSKLDEIESCALDFDDFLVVGIDDSNMTEAELKSHLAHEIGHCETAAFYNMYSPVDNRRKNEYKANVWAVKKLLDKQELLRAYERGLVECWQIAEEFSITEELARFACDYYAAND